jgi:hypothetical protein
VIISYIVVAWLKDVKGGSRAAPEACFKPQETQ